MQIINFFSGKVPVQWRAVLGSSSRNSSTTSFNVARFTFHPSYNVLSLFDADVAIVHLASSAELSQTINTAAVASATSVVFPGLPVTSIGWGSGVIISQLSSIITNKKLDFLVPYCNNCGKYFSPLCHCDSFYGHFRKYFFL